MFQEFASLIPETKSPDLTRAKYMRTSRLLYCLVHESGSFFPDGASISDHYPSGYMVLSGQKFNDGTCCNKNTPDDTLYNTTFIDSSLAWTAGAMISNANDLVKIVKGQVEGTYPPLSPELLGERFAFVNTGKSFPAPYGEITYGLGIYAINGYLGHIGEISGFDSAVFFLEGTQQYIDFV